MALEKIIELLLALALAIGSSTGLTTAAERVGAAEPPDATVESEPADEEPAEDDESEELDEGMATAIARISENLERLRAHLATAAGDDPSGDALDEVREQAPRGLELALEVLTGIAAGDGVPDEATDEDAESDAESDDGPPFEPPIPDIPGPPARP